MAKRGVPPQGRSVAAAPAVPGAGMRRAGSLARAWLLGTTALLPAGGVATAQVAPNARPTGGAVVAGSASIAQGASQTTVTQSSQRAAVEWQQFNVGSQHTVQIVQPNAQAATLNRVVGPDPSVIAGRIRATTPDGGVGGMVAIVNQSGVVFANGSQVNVGSLIASASNITNQNFMAGRMVFDGPARPGARVENHGTITVADRGLAALVGPRVSNTGLIQGRLARVALQGGAETYSLDLAGDGMLAIDVTQAVRGSTNGVALATNSGVIEAPGGSVLISAHAASGLVEDLVRNTGRISANTEGGRAGQVALRAEGGNVRIEGRVEARGAAPGQSGGRVEATAAGGSVTVAAGARVSASGDAAGGSVQIGGRTTREARVEGVVTARSRTGRGGQVAVQASDAATVATGARVDVSGAAGGGRALIGTEGVGRNQVMAARTTVAAGAVVRADATAAGDGGLIVVNASGAMEALGSFSARGGPGGGDGGFLELSGQGNMTIAAAIDLGAPAGRMGTLLLDPDRIQVIAGGTVTTSAGPFAATGTAGLLTIDPGAITAVNGDVVLLASRSITVSTAITQSAGNLTLKVDQATTAGTDGIFVNAPITITGNNHALTLTSTSDGTTPQGVIAIAASLSTDGNAATAISITGGSIATSGTATITSGSGLTLLASGGITLDGGAIGAATASTIAVTGSRVSTSGSAAIGFSGSGNSNNNAVTITANGTGATPGGITLGAAVNADTGSVALLARSDQAISQTASGVITARTLDAGGSGGTDAGSIALGSANRATRLTGARAAGSIDVRSDVASFDVSGVSGNGVTLGNGQAGGGLSVTGSVAGQASALLRADAIGIGGPLSATTVTLRPFTDNTSVTLGASGLAQGSLDNVTATLLSIRGNGTGGIGLASNISAPGTVQTLELVGAEITQSNGTLAAPRLHAVATTGSVQLIANAGNQIGVIAGSATGDFVVVANGTMSVGSVAGTNGISTGASGSTRLLSVSGDMTQTQPVIGGGKLQLAADAGDITFTAANAVSVLAANPERNLTFVNAQALDIGLVGITGVGIAGRSGQTLNLQVGGALTQSAAITGGSTLIASGTSVQLTNTGNSVASISGTATAAYAFSTSGPLVVGGTGIAGGSVTLQADSMTIGSLVSAPGGEITLRPNTALGVVLGGTQVGALSLTAADLAQLGDAASATSRLRITSGAGIDLAGNVGLGTRIGSLALEAAGAVTQSGGNLTVSRLVVTAGGAVSLARPGAANRIDELAVRLTASAAVTVSGTGGASLATVSDAASGISGIGTDAATPSSVSLTAPALTVGGGIRGGSVTLQADSMTIGSLISAPGGEIVLRPNTTLGVVLGGTQVGTLSLTAADLAQLGDAASATSRLRITSGAGIEFAGTVNLRPRIGALVLEATDGITQSGGNLDVARLVARASTGISVARSGATNSIDEVAARLSGAGSVSISATGRPSVATVNDAVSGIAGVDALPASSVTLSGVAIAVGADIRSGQDLTLAASGTITQSSGGIQASTLVVRGLAGPGSAAGSVELESASNRIGSLAGVAAAGLVAVRSDVSSLGVSGSVTSTGGDVRLVNGSGGAIAVGTGTVSATSGTVTLRADGFDLGSSGIRVSGDTVAFGPFSALNLQLGGASPPAGTLLIDGSQLARISATSRVVVGNAGTLDVSVPQTFDFSSVAPTLRIVAGGSIQQSAGAALIGNTLQADAGGSVTLTTTTNQVASVGGSTGTNGVFRYTDLDGFAVTGIAAPSGTVGLIAGGAGSITQSGAITTGTLTAQAGGSVTLTTTTNQVASVGGTAGTGGVFRYTDTDGFEVSGIAAPSGTVALIAGGAGSITQSGAVTTGALTAQAGGSVTLTTTTNQVASVGGSAGTGGAFRYTDTDGFEISGIAAPSGTVALIAGAAGSITQSGAITTGTLTAQAGGLVTLTTTTNQVATVGGTAGTGGVFRYTDTDGFEVSGIAAPSGTVALIAGAAGSITQSGAVTTGTLTAQAGGSVTLTTTTNQVATVGGTAGTGGAFRYTDTDGFEVSGIAASSGTVALIAGNAGTITQSNAIETGALSATAGGSVTLTNTNNQVASVTGSAGTNGVFRYTDLDGFAVTGISAPSGTVTLIAGAAGSITQSGAITTGTLTAQAGGLVTLTTTTNQVATVGGTAGTGGAFRYTDTDGFEVSGIAAPSGTVALIAGNAGTITQSNAIETGALSATAGGSVALTNTNNQVTSVTGTATSGDFRYTDQNGLAIGAAGIAATAGTVALTAGGTGSITQAGRVQASTLAANAGGSVTLLATDNQVASVGGSAGSGGAFRYTDADGFAVTGIAAPSGTVDLIAGGTGSITQGGTITTGALSAAAGGSVTLTNTGNQVTSVTGTATNGDFRYTDTDGFEVGGTGIRASGTVELTAGGAGTITQSGEIQGAALLVFSGGSVALDTQSNQVPDVGGAVTTGDFRYRSQNSFNITGVNATSTVELESVTGSITQSGAIRGATLAATAAGSVNLGTQVNEVASAGGTATAGGFALRNARTLTVTGISAGTVVGLTSETGSILQTGAITGTAVPVGLVAVASAAGQSVTLDSLANRIGSVAGLASSSFAVLGDAALRVTTLSSSATGASPIAGITTTGATGTVDLRTSGSRLDQDAPIRTVSLRAIASGGPVDLVGTGNLVSVVAGASGTSYALRNGQSLSIGTVRGTAGIVAPSVDLRVTAGNLAQTATITATDGLLARADAGAVTLNLANTVGTLAGSAAGNFTLLNNQGLIIGTRSGVSGVTSTGGGATAITLATTAGDLVQQGGTITALGAGAAISLASIAGSVSQTTGIIATRQLRVQSGTGIQLANANQFDQLTGADFGTGGGVLRGQSYTVTGDVVAARSLALLAQGGLSIGSAGIAPAITSTGGGITLATDTGALGIGTSSLRALGGALALTGTGGVTLAGTQLTASGNLTIGAPGGSMAATNLVARSGGDTSLSARGDITLTGIDALAGGTLSASAGGTLAVAGGRLSSQSQQPAAGLTLEGLNGVSIQNADLTAATRLTIRDAPGVVIDSATLNADTALVDGPTILLGAVRAVIGTSILFRGPGGVTSTQPLVVQPRSQGQFPAVIYDTRTLPQQTAEAILAYVRPDLPGLQPDQQPTQLTSIGGGADIFFGRATAAPAGAITLNIQAPGSAVFLLLDGGTATGNIVAGRLLVHGTGGSANLFGTLSGVGGSGAARASDITDPTAAGGLADYRINSCVIGSVNCVVAPRFQPIPPTVRTNVDFIFRQNAFNPADVIIPNTGEDDYE